MEDARIVDCQDTRPRRCRSRSKKGYRSHNIQIWTTEINRPADERRLMSALGQKRTCALQNVMSALHPIATAKAKIRKRPCLLYPQKRTCAAQRAMSALGQ